MSRERKKEGEPANDYWVCNFVNSTCNGCQTTLVRNESIIQKGLQQIHSREPQRLSGKEEAFGLLPRMSLKNLEVLSHNWLLCGNHSTNVL